MIKPLPSCVKRLTFCLNGTNVALILACTQHVEPCCTCVSVALIWCCFYYAVKTACKAAIYQRPACFRFAILKRQLPIPLSWQRLEFVRLQPRTMRMQPTAIHVLH